MLPIRLLQSKVLLNVMRNVSVFNKFQHTKSEIVVNLKTTLPEHKKKLEKRIPFAKSLFLGQFDEEFIIFPECQSSERHPEFLEWLKQVESYILSRKDIPLNIQTIEDLTNFGVFRANLSSLHGGLNFNNTEINRLLETLSLVPSLGPYFLHHNINPIKIINTYGNKKQKDYYLPRIGTGELIPTLCFAEKDGRANLSQIQTYATQSVCHNFITLNGTKVFVPNGKNANLFLILAHYTISLDINKSSDNLTLYMVESNLEGVSCEDIKESIRLKDVYTCSVKLKDVKIPITNQLGRLGDGAEAFIDINKPENSSTSPITICLLRKFVNLLCEHIFVKKHLDKNMYQIESVQMIMGQLVATLYCMESLTYLTAGLSDIFNNQDMTLEMAVTETYCRRQCIDSICKGLQMAGTEAFVKDNPFFGIFQEALEITMFNNNHIDSDLYTSTLALQSVGLAMKGIIKKKEYCHPSLKEAATILEENIHVLKTSGFQLLVDYGTTIAECELLLQRLGQMLTNICVLNAVISRASRSYCTGINNSENERQLALGIADIVNTDLKMLAYTVQCNDWRNGDAIYKNVANLLFTKKNYVFEHPLTRNR
ncbi:complex I assembly factor ACAD9, mitochondrial-like [Prorops nasuta]|uniref:complex I assembly factor ACAD9, mitochondrial-like n=1 Tax=Prorops nasuta TaxID=863751 RepID=UPI0034CD72B9